MRVLLLFVSALFLYSCRGEQPAEQKSVDVATAPEPVIVHEAGKTIESRFSPPAGYTRTNEPAGSYGQFLRRSALQPHGSSVHYYNGAVKRNDGVYAAVLTYDAGTQDLQQCADAVMRLRAEYLFDKGAKSRIGFTLTNGFRMGFKEWMEGNRLSVKGNKTGWVQAGTPAADHAALRSYLDIVYTYAGTLSLSKELLPVPYPDMKIGDVLIVGGSPGHAVTVMDMAVDKAGKKVFMLSQSYMPAQDIQVLENPLNSSISPWYELDPANTLVITPEWKFTTSQLKRFPGE